MIQLKEVSKKVSKEEWKKFGINLLKFFAPALAVFFGQLALGVDAKAALLVAALAFYGVAADWLKKFTEVK